jgi:uncharacterized protein (TIGR02246 family)
VKRRMAQLVAVVLVALVPAWRLLPAFLLLSAGCSSRSVETGMSSRPATMVAETRTTSAAKQPAATTSHGHRPVRPIPEVIAKAKPFRMAPASTAKALPQPIRNSSTSGVATASAVVPQPMHSRPTTGPDVAGINRMMRSYLQAFNRHDPAALAAHWSKTGESVDIDSGETTAGREAVREVFAALFEQDADATIDIDVASIRSLRDDVAVVDGVSRISFTDAPPSSSRFSAVLVREDGNWVLDTVRESNAAPQHAEAAPVSREPARPLDELAWLVGSWEDVSEGVTASTHCFWSTNKAFLIRTHAVSSDAVQEQRPLPGDSRIPGLLPAGAAGSREITEIIGWDPDRGQIRSWLFTSGGRFAEGSWSRQGDAWTLRLEDASGDCLCTLTRVGPDEMTCRCDSDRFADIAPPACDSVRTAAAGLDATRLP